MYLLQGFLLGLAYVAPIGMQNLYVINTAIKGDKIKTYKVALITIFFDILLALSCFLGVGYIIKNIPILKAIILLLGSFIIIYIGINLIKSSSELNKEVNINEPLIKIIGICFSVTWLNPQALIDGALLLGGYRASIPESMSKIFIIGFCSASFLWFLTLSTITLKLRTKLNENILKGINISCGIILILFGIKLAYSFIKLIT
ncbi:MAG: amino acid transporter [Firmicutes bacterium]|nr:amino acid transporter [Bacillota bacterium]